MKKLISLLGFVFIVYVEAGLSVNGFFDRAQDGVRFKKLFQDNLQSKDLATLYYASQGLKYLEETVPNASDVCKSVKALSQGTLNVEQNHYAASIAAVLKCSADTLKSDVLKTALQSLDNAKSTLSDLSHAILTLKALGNKGHDTETAVKSLKEFLKKDDSVTK